MNATARNIARFRLHWSGCSDRGKVRANNEDAFVGLRFNQQELERLGKEGQSTLQTADFVFAVSDGMGGALAGEFASRIAVEKVPQILPKGFRSESGHPKADSAEVLLQALFQEIHKALVYLGRSYEECRGMETTLSLCWFAPGLLHFAHVGDSRIYHLPVTLLLLLLHTQCHIVPSLQVGRLPQQAACVIRLHLVPALAFHLARHST